MKKTYAIINYGCQMNESDSEHYAGQLLDLGYEASADYEHADVVVIILMIFTLVKAVCWVLSAR